MDIIKKLMVHIDKADSQSKLQLSDQHLYQMSTLCNRQVTKKINPQQGDNIVFSAPLNSLNMKNVLRNHQGGLIVRLFLNLETRTKKSICSLLPNNGETLKLSCVFTNKLKLSARFYKELVPRYI